MKTYVDSYIQLMDDIYWLHDERHDAIDPDDLYYDKMTSKIY